MTTTSSSASERAAEASTVAAVKPETSKSELERVPKHIFRSKTFTYNIFTTWSCVNHCKKCELDSLEFRRNRHRKFALYNLLHALRRCPSISETSEEVDFDMADHWIVEMDNLKEKMVAWTKETFELDMQAIDAEVPEGSKECFNASLEANMLMLSKKDALQWPIGQL
ncbi:MAG: hypothetical protein Q9226_003289 [Calogaya cf. arnoldii]